jgi:hypothetical protein
MICSADTREPGAGLRDYWQLNKQLDYQLHILKMLYDTVQLYEAVQVWRALDRGVGEKYS